MPNDNNATLYNDNENILSQNKRYYRNNDSVIILLHCNYASCPVRSRRRELQ